MKEMVSGCFLLMSHGPKMGSSKYLIILELVFKNPDNRIQVPMSFPVLQVSLFLPRLQSCLYVVRMLLMVFRLVNGR